MQASARFVFAIPKVRLWSVNSCELYLAPVSDSYAIEFLNHLA
jgi:hypothetical protein